MTIAITADYWMDVFHADESIAELQTCLDDRKGNFSEEDIAVLKRALKLISDALPSGEEDEGDETAPRGKKRKRAGTPKPKKNASEISYGPLFKLRTGDLKEPEGFSGWLANPATFFAPPQKAPGSTTAWSGNPQEKAVADHYDLTKSILTRMSIDHIRSRVCKLIFANIRSSVSTNQRLSAEDLKTVVDRVCKYGGEPPEQVTRNVGTWWKEGQVLLSLGSALGQGWVFFVPQSVTDSLIHRMNISGETHEKAIEHLKDQGLEALAASTEANSLVDRILEPILKAIGVE